MTKTQTLLYRRILPAAGLAVLLTVVVFVLEAFGALRELERVTYDIVAQLPFGNAKPSPVVLVLIEDQDFLIFDRVADRNSPLTDLRGLIDEVVAHRARFVGTQSARKKAM